MIGSFPQVDWTPSASISNLQQRAAILGKIRHFFAERSVIEVDTPTMSQACVTDPHLHSFATRYNNTQQLFLQTSPEFHMKRLLCAGSGSIYQICKAFRDEESGRYHNPEFTILEWYRTGFDHFKLMQEVDELVRMVLGCQPAEQLSYAEAFERYLAINPLTASLPALKQIIATFSNDPWLNEEVDRDTLLQWLFSEQIEPQIGIERPCFIYHFPASQAALARLNPADPSVACRFELYYRGIELVNGFYELSDSNEQHKRFEEDNRKRRSLNRPDGVIDRHLLTALQHGLPDCAGVALGVDRLIMLALNCQHIDEVIAFPVDRA